MEFFNQHTYYTWENFIDVRKCLVMTNEVKKAFNNINAYKEKPGLLDDLIQNNTKHLEKIGKTRKYEAIYGEMIKNNTPTIFEYYNNQQVIKKYQK